MRSKILVIAATEMELAGLPDRFGSDVCFFASGASSPCTIMRLTELLTRTHFDVAINIGIAGSYSAKIPLGSVFRVVHDHFADLGIETPQGFVPLREFPFCPTEIADMGNYSNEMLANLGIQTANGFTYNTVHGSPSSIARLNISHGLESMEGAAVVMVCQHFGISHIQIRAVSNYVEPRNPKGWNIPLALENLQSAVSSVLYRLLDSQNDLHKK